MSTSHHPVVLDATSKAAIKAEKTRQKIASLHVANIYIFIMAGVLGFFILRNIILVVQQFFFRRRRNALVASGTDEKPSMIHGPKPFIQRWFDRIDAIALRPVTSRFVPQDWTRLRLFITFLIIVANIVCCLVVAVSSPLPNQAGSSLARSFSRRCGRIAVANYPILYCFAGRNNIIANLTGISYQELRFYHILIGGIAFVESFIHTFAYLGHYLVYQPREALREEYSELYFKMGIVAVVFMATNCIFGLKWIRRRSYEIFLTLHIIGAALILAGSWYHRPIITPWVYAAVAIWSFERTVRLVWHVSSIVNSRVILRRPLVEAKASIVSGAIKLSVPYPRGRWEKGQHAYITFWGIQFLRSPWYFGQPHPFSISNIPDTTKGDAQELRFVVRIHHGITETLARHIERKCKATGKEEVSITVGLEGPHGWAPAAEEFDSLLVIAGGSGITHPLSVVADVCRRASEGIVQTKHVRLIWAMHHADQVEWVRETLDEARRDATKANLSLTIEVYVTRRDRSFNGSTPLDSPSISSIDGEEKKEDFGFEIASLPGIRQFIGRPDVEDQISRTVSESVGTSLVVACGPTSLADEVRQVSLRYPASSLQVQIASFEC